MYENPLSHSKTCQLIPFSIWPLLPVASTFKEKIMWETEEWGNVLSVTTSIYSTNQWQLIKRFDNLITNKNTNTNNNIIFLLTTYPYNYYNCTNCCILTRWNIQVGAVKFYIVLLLYNFYVRVLVKVWFEVRWYIWHAKSKFVEIPWQFVSIEIAFPEKPVKLYWQIENPNTSFHFRRVLKSC